MKEKKELNQADLENVSGGDARFDPERLTWRHTYGKKLTIRKANSYETHSGIVEKKGYCLENGLYYAVIYVNCAENPNYSRWYLDESDTWVKEKNSYKETEVTEKPW